MSNISKRETSSKFIVKVQIKDFWARSSSQRVVPIRQRSQHHSNDLKYGQPTVLVLVRNFLQYRPSESLLGVGCSRSDSSHFYTVDVTSMMLPLWSYKYWTLSGKKLVLKWSQIITISSYLKDSSRRPAGKDF